jgi:hypothetical protein
VTKRADPILRTRPTPPGEGLGHWNWIPVSTTYGDRLEMPDRGKEQSSPSRRCAGSAPLLAAGRLAGSRRWGPARRGPLRPVPRRRTSTTTARQDRGAGEAWTNPRSRCRDPPADRLRWQARESRPSAALLTTVPPAGTPVHGSDPRRPLPSGL